MKINTLKKNLLKEIFETFKIKYTLYDVEFTGSFKGKRLPDQNNICYENKTDIYYFTCKIDHCWILEIEYKEVFNYYKHDNNVQKKMYYSFNFKLNDVYCYKQIKR